LRHGWDAFAFIVWLPIFAAMTDTYGGGGSILALLLLPVAWIIWVNLREHWIGRDDEPED
jgi:hypothetical protein